ncbi:MAG TPA: DNA repair protein RecO [Dehalococcoidia bacterium]|nr:DNA repair protein RecO [Dehalococcoidia bacterium]
MIRPRNYQTEAVIIKKTRLGEADSILTMYTPDMGKIQGFAKSLRRPRSKMAGHLELLTHSKVSLARGRNLDTITGGQTITAFLPLKSDLWLTSYGLYAIELVNQFTAEHVESPPLFQLLLDTMHNLCQEETNKESTLRYFELHLLHEVGYRPQLQHCVTCKSPLQPVTNYFSPIAGGTLCPNCGPQQVLSHPLTTNALKVLRFFQENDYNTTNHLKIDQELSQELEAIMRGYIKYLLERDVKSVDWLDTLRAQMTQANSSQQATT